MSNTLATVKIDAQFCGPPDSGNGGYVSGLLAGFVGGVAAVRLKKPPPLDVELSIVQAPEGGANLLLGDEVLATAIPSRLNVDLPEPVSLSQARAGQTNFLYPDPEQHLFAGCFVCGPARTIDDGLRVFPGAVPGRELVASTWRPQRWLGDDEGSVDDAFVWAAMDCPGAFAFDTGSDVAPMVLGQMSARVDIPVRVGREYAVAAWPIGKQGRKNYAAVTLYDDKQRLCAVAEQTWITIDLKNFGK